MRPLVLVLLGFVCAPLPALAAETEPPWTKDGPPCFAYSKAERRFACTGLWAEPYLEAEQSDVSSETMDDSLETAKARDACITLGVLLTQTVDVDPFSDPELELYITQVVHPGEDEVHLTPISEVKKLLRKRGYDSNALETALLPEETWVAVGESERQLRFTLDFHEGDASFEYTGHLEAQCHKDGPSWPVFPRHDLGGPLAAVSWADPDVVVVTLEVHDGGEGWVESHREHWHLDLAAFCRSQISSSTR